MGEGTYGKGRKTCLWAKPRESWLQSLLRHRPLRDLDQSLSSPPVKWDHPSFVCLVHLGRELSEAGAVSCHVSVQSGETGPSPPATSLTHLSRRGECRACDRREATAGLRRAWMITQLQEGGRGPPASMLRELFKPWNWCLKGPGRPMFVRTK